MNNKNYYFVEGTAEKDLIGFDSYLNALQIAIENKSRFIGLISDFGTGKSTLIKMLKNQNDTNLDVININLWNCNNKVNDNIDIHRMFLHQLIEEVDIDSKDYYKKKINKNYKIFDIKLAITNKFYMMSLFVFYLMLIFNQFGFISIFIYDSQKISVFFLVAILTILNIFIYKPIFSFKREDSTTHIDENDTKDLYQEILNNYFSRKQSKEKTLVICIEELDRYDNPEYIVTHLKEFYNFYKLSKNKVVFIVAVKSAGMLLDNNNNNNLSTEKIKNTYEKIFDFILNINKVNIHDFDSILLDLLSEKIDNMPDNIKMPTSDNMKSWRYLYKGKNITIRDIKHRYNFAISLYESIKESGIEKVNFNKCLYISYLEDEYNELYTKLISDSLLLNNVLIEYAGNKNIKSNEYLSDEEIKIIIEGITFKYIDIDYMYYFFKFPKNKKSYSMYELNLYNSILFDENNDQLDKSIDKLADLDIENILKKRVEPEIMPNIVFDYTRLINVAFFSEKNYFINTLVKKYSIINNFVQFSDIKNKIEKCNRQLYIEIFEMYFEREYKEINTLNNDQKLQLRIKLVGLFKADSFLFRNLFIDCDDLITKEEIEAIGNLKVIYNLTNKSKINENYIDYILKYIRKESKTFIKTFLKEMSSNELVTSVMYKKLFKELRFNLNQLTESDCRQLYNISKEKIELTIIANFIEFVNELNSFCKFLDDTLVRMIDSNNSDDVKKYISICEQFDYMSDCGTDLIDKCSTKFQLNERLLLNMYARKHYYTYVISKTLNTGIFEVEEDKFENLKDLYYKFFTFKKDWKYVVGEKMISNLYNNINPEGLSPKQLVIFNKLPQTKEFISAVLSTDDFNFINNYLLQIPSLKKSHSNDILNQVGQYYRKKDLRKNSKKNIMRFAKTRSQKDLFDKRKKIYI